MQHRSAEHESLRVAFTAAISTLEYVCDRFFDRHMAHPPEATDELRRVWAQHHAALAQETTVQTLMESNTNEDARDDMMTELRYARDDVREVLKATRRAARTCDALFVYP